MIFLYHLQGVSYDGQVPQPQEVHLQKSQLLYRRHVELSGKSFVRQIQRNVLVYVFLGNDHAGRMSRRVTGHPLYGSCHVDDFSRSFLVIVLLLQLGAGLQRLVYGHLQ